MKENILVELSKCFAVDIVNVCNRIKETISKFMEYHKESEVNGGIYVRKVYKHL